MVVDAAFLAGTIASFMMNGACCMYQLSREEELKQDLRKEIRKEWYQQRSLELQNMQAQQIAQKAAFEGRYQQLLKQHSSSSGVSYCANKTSQERKQRRRKEAQQHDKQQRQDLEDKQELESRNASMCYPSSSFGSSRCGNGNLTGCRRQDPDDVEEDQALNVNRSSSLLDEMEEEDDDVEVEYEYNEEQEQMKTEPEKHYHYDHSHDHDHLMFVTSAGADAYQMEDIPLTS